MLSSEGLLSLDSWGYAGQAWFIFLSPSFQFSEKELLKKCPLKEVTKVFIVTDIPSTRKEDPVENTC